MFFYNKFVKSEKNTKVEIQKPKKKSSSESKSNNETKTRDNNRISTKKNCNVIDVCKQSKYEVETNRILESTFDESKLCGISEDDTDILTSFKEKEQNSKLCNTISKIHGIKGGKSKNCADSMAYVTKGNNQDSNEFFEIHSKNKSQNSDENVNYKEIEEENTLDSWEEWDSDESKNMENNDKMNLKENSKEDFKNIDTAAKTTINQNKRDKNIEKSTKK